MNVFISYAAADRELVEDLSETLKRHGLQVWRQDMDIMPGENWAVKYGEALRNADAMVVVVSEASARSSQLINDISFAISEIQFKDRLIPLYCDRPSNMDTSDLPWPLKKMMGVEVPAFSTRVEAFEAVAEQLKSAEATV